MALDISENSPLLENPSSAHVRFDLQFCTVFTLYLCSYTPCRTEMLLLFLVILITLPVCICVCA